MDATMVVTEEAIRQKSLDIQYRALALIEESWDTDDDSGQMSGGVNLRVPPRNQLSRPMRSTGVSLSDTADGRYMPYYEHHRDLMRNLQVARNIWTFDSVGLNALETVSMYTLSGPWTYRVTSDNRDAARRAQYVIDRFLDYNCWADPQTGQLSLQMIPRRDGELWITLYAVTGDQIVMEQRTAEQCREPVNKRALNEWLSTPGGTWSFGVHCRLAEYAHRTDWQRPLGWHFVEDEAGRQWEYVPSWPQPKVLDDVRCGYHLKRNAPARAARGVSDYYPILGELERAWKLARNTAEGAAIQAAIAFVITRANSSRVATLSDVVGNAIDMVQQIGARGGVDQHVRRFDPGTVVEADDSSQYTPGPMGSSDANTYIEVGQWLLRHRIATRWHMTESMISGDASNNAYASLLAAEAPFVKAAEVNQQHQRHIEEQVLWRVLRMAHYLGRFGGMSWQEVEQGLQLDITPPEIATRDPVAQTQRYEVLYRNGVVSHDHWATVEGVEPENRGKPVDPTKVAPGPSGGMAGIPSALGESERTTLPDLSESWRRYWKGYP